MTINSAYILATQVQKIPENPDSGMVKKNGLYYPEWATDYLLVSAQIVSDANENVDIRHSSANHTYGRTMAAGCENGGFCLIYHVGDWSPTTTSSGWSVNKIGVSKNNTGQKACIFTFPSLQKAKMALLTGQLGEAVWNSGISGHNLTFWVGKHNLQIGWPYYEGLTGIYQINAVRSEDGATYFGTISTQSLGAYFASSGFFVKHSSCVISSGQYPWTTLAARALT